MPRVAVEMKAKYFRVGADATLAPGLLFKSVLVAGTTAMLATVATGYCPINAALNNRDPEASTLADAQELQG